MQSQRKPLREGATGADRGHTEARVGQSGDQSTRMNTSMPTARFCMYTVSRLHHSAPRQDEGDHSVKTSSAQVTASSLVEQPDPDAPRLDEPTAKTDNIKGVDGDGTGL